MNQTNRFSFLSWLRNNLLLLVSTGAALCLFLTPSKITILLEIAIFLAVTGFTLICGSSQEDHRETWLSFLPAVAFSGIGFATFFIAWTNSSIMAAVAGILHLPVRLLVLAVGIVGAVVALYAFSRLARWMENRIASVLPVSSDSIGKNLKANWFFPLSGAVFFAVETNFTAMYHMGLVAAVAMLVLLAGRLPSLVSLTRNMDRKLHLISFLSTLGICLSERDVFSRNWAEYSEGVNPLSGGLWILVAIATFPFVYICTAAFFRWLWQQLRASGLLRRMDKGSWIFCGVALLVLICITTLVFLNTDGFYGTPYRYDIIYTSDSPILVRNDTYLALSYKENDLRQPMFALFSAPVMGIPALLRNLLPLSETGHAIVMNWMQLAVLMLTLVLLGDLLELTGKEKVAFWLLGAACYPFGLFCLMMEQYIFAVFYLVLAIYLMKLRLHHRVALWGAGGTLLTSVILLPGLCREHPIRAFRDWLREFCGYCVEFVALMIVFARLNIILDISGALEKMGQFSGETLTWADRIFRYTQFVRSCVFAPAGEVIPNLQGAASWQLVPAGAPDLLGIAIFGLCIVSIVLNRKNFAARICGIWVGFSLVILLGLGWGAAENGQILYALYFGWAFLVPLYLLIQNLAQRLKLPVCIPAAGFAVVVAVVNLPALSEMIQFALTHYPL